jgi:hypothetical protein
MVEGGNDFRGMIFQVMDHVPDGTEPLPSFQLEMRDGNLNFRYSNILKDGTNQGSSISFITKPVFGTNTNWHVFDFYFYLSNDTDGYIRVYYNKKFVAERRGINGSTYNEKAHMQYGIYCKPYYKLRTQVKSVLIETVSGIPMNNTI